MDNKQFHQGSRLKFRLEKSGYKIKEIIEKTGIARSSLHDMYKKPELLKSKIAPILEAAEIDIDDFYGIKEPVAASQEMAGLRLQVESLKRETQLLNDQLKAKDEIIELLKAKK